MHERAQVANFALNERLIALRPDKIRRCSRVVAVAAGQDKVGPIRSVLGGGYVSVRVADEETATTSLQEDGEAA